MVWSDIKSTFSGEQPLNQTFETIQDSLSKYIVRPLNAFGMAGFIFDVEGDTTQTLSADITDNFTESNVFIQDHISIKPIKVTLRNYVGELVYEPNQSDNQFLEELTEKLTVLNNVLPQLSDSALQLKNSLDTNNLNFKNMSALATTQGSNLWGLVKNISPAATRQEQVYRFFKALWQQKVLFSVQTPYEYLTNMAIETITVKQGSESKFISDFSITLKQIRFASTKTERKRVDTSGVVNPTEKQELPVYDEPADYQGQTLYQRAPEVNQGIVYGDPPLDLNQVGDLLEANFEPDLEPL
jgi:hypothetical protein